ncbi:MAG: hypothetical protein HGA31_00165 [Candidatus Moranbacteria bacterium]|nr:hypothetical protein [Candidatus Moranbacteria bacterium]
MKEHLYFYGYRGELMKRPFDSLETLSAANHCPPLLEQFISDSGKASQYDPVLIANPSGRESISLCLATDAYAGVGRYGHFGDAVRVSRYDIGNGSYLYVADAVGHLAYHKPGVAADILPFIRDSDGNLYFICIRKGEAGSGPLALVGGFIDKKGVSIESAAESAIREGFEEIGLRLKPRDSFPRDDGNPHPDHIEVRAEFQGSEKSECRLKLLGTVFTPTSDADIAYGFQRVSMTTAYMAVFEIGKTLSVADVKGMFKGDGSEVKEVVVLSRREFSGASFKDSHHRKLFEQALGMLDIRV